MQGRVESNTKRGITKFARRLLAEWRALGLPRNSARVVVAASGGADSTALLLALAELKGRRLISVELKVAHLDHGLRREAGAEDARWIESLTGNLGFEFASARAGVKERARTTRDNLEQAARRERYEFLSQVAHEWGAQLVVTGHTLDDQAETVLLALLRGSGADGLSGMRPARALCDDDPSLLLARPLLGWARRAETREYCAVHCVAPREDEMNDDERFARVRVRKQMIPLLETLNPRAVEAVARAAGLLREDADALEAEASELLCEAKDESARRRVVRDEGPVAGKDRVDAESDIEREGRSALPLRVEVLLRATTAVRRRALRRWLALARGNLRRIELSHVVALEKLLEGERGGRVAELPGGGRVERRGRWILFRMEK
ncbi:MAG: tRNA(Ile)-lysidine synthase [Acidobacteriota bacterium]|nr:tRNA(Ile)-lysidine synthase [Acidobacteriota bacterium]